MILLAVTWWFVYTIFTGGGAVVEKRWLFFEEGEAACRLAWSAKEVELLRHHKHFELYPCEPSRPDKTPR